ncbi:hypothetical protein [Poseidonocella sedimentorum]|uniref:Arginine transporter n=1 Tax=Poseidonocella sedimentorum TaxID=871652 RepID=A0A1I6EHN9_9RHOB|nr:hypothetical protein [Poseidonocella sedimentorum]SFR17259.1 hypothetical protein SAMN04515673_11243 [Poseidonocella sedimentorum]
MKHTLLLCATLTLAACGGKRDVAVSRMSMTPAVGPISQACLASDRKARSRSLCGCIQSAANRTLTSADQSRAATFYRDPHQAQEIRMSDRGSHEAFWQRYKNYAETAEAYCS